MFGVMQKGKKFLAFYDRILFMWHYVRILCNYEVLCRNKYQGIFLSLRILVISA